MNAAGLIDSHCHLDYLERDGTLANALETARAVGLRGMLTIGTKLDDDAVAQGAAIAAAHDDVWRTVGLHPHNAAEATPDIRDRLRALADGPDVVGIGESGLDYHYDYAPRAVQAASFEAHLDVAAETGLPLVVHTREAEADTLAILRNFAGRARGVLHCFTGSRAMAEAGVDLGYHVSFSGVITFKRSDDLRATAAAMPEDRLLVETDSPYLAPVPFRGKPCQPAYVAHTATALAGARGVDAETIAATTSANFAALFPKTANA